MPAVRHLVGREQELDAIVRLLDAPEQLSGAAVLSGEAGMGKTTLWLAAIDAASARDYRILSCRPAEAETRFSFVGLADLLGDATGDVLPGLPPVQQRALEAALLLGEPDVHADERAVAAAFLGALRILAADAFLCLAVDDVQWLDAASLAALRYALARLGEDPVAALLAVRGREPEWVRRAVPEGRLRTIEVGGLSVGAIHELLHARLDLTFPRPTLIRLWETSRGNPFFALELATALRDRGGTLAPGEELPIPSDLDELLQARVAALGEPALAVARAVGAIADPTVALVEAALGGRRFDDGLAEALQAGILALEGERLRFTHPLLGSAVAARQAPGSRRSLHARLAEIVPSAEERARHLALATAAPDDAAASILEEAARSAYLRGAPAAAAELAEQALRLTSSSNEEDTRRRLLVASDMHNRAGDIERATALLEQARAAAPPGSERATVLVHLARVQHRAPEAIAVYREALLEAEGDDALEATIHLNLAALMRFSDGIGRGVEHAELAVLAASRVGDPALRCRALAARGLTGFNAGRGIRRAEMEEALSLERSLVEWPLDGGPTQILAHQLLWSGDLDPARTLMHEVRRACNARSDAQLEADALWYLAFLEWRAGNWLQAEHYAAKTVELHTQLGLVSVSTEMPPTVIVAHMGRVDDARDGAERVLKRAEAEGVRVVEANLAWILGFVELSLGNADAALRHLRRGHDLRTAFLSEPGMRLELGDLLEALIAVGDLEEAGEVLASWEGRAAALDRAWALAILARCRGLLLAAQGDLERAFESFESALSEHARSTDPFHHARTLLALGKTQRRAKQRRAARATLEDALARFERLGAPLWAEQARGELARIGGRRGSRGELTEAESRIAALVAEGRTNREVAAALFLTEHSVETALTRVYRKLDVRSRAELAHHLAAKS